MHTLLLLSLLCCRAFSTVQGVGWPYDFRSRMNKVHLAATEPDQRYTADRQTHHQPRARLTHSGVTAVVFHNVSWTPLSQLSVVWQAKLWHEVLFSRTLPLALAQQHTELRPLTHRQAAHMEENVQDSDASRLLNCYLERDLKGLAGGIIDEVIWVVDASPEAEQVRPRGCWLHLARHCLRQWGRHGGSRAMVLKLLVASGVLRFRISC